MTPYQDPHQIAQPFFQIPTQTLINPIPQSTPPHHPYSPISSEVSPPPGAPSLGSEWEEMKNTIKALQVRNESKTFKFEMVCPYPFDRAITMNPFPKHFEIPKFDKFRGKGDPVTHVK